MGVNTKVYLAGGCNEINNWHQKVIDTCPNFIYFNPKVNSWNGNDTLQKYGAWDIHHVRQADIILAYIDKNNPSGFGTVCEVAYSKGLGKTTILCIEKDNKFNDYRYISFVELFADIVFYDFEEMLKHFVTYNND